MIYVVMILVVVGILGYYFLVYRAKEIVGKKIRQDAIKNNPAFEYVEDKYNIDCKIYRELSLLIRNCAVAAANKFAKMFGEKSNEDLVHYFYDYFLYFYVTKNSKDFHPENEDISHTLIDGIHIEFYGNASKEIIAFSLQLNATENKCFLSTAFDSFKNEGSVKSMMLLGSIGCHCTGKKDFGGTDKLSWTKAFMDILPITLSSINKSYLRIQEILNEKKS